MANLRATTFSLPGSYGLNSQDDIALDDARRFGSTVSNGVVDASGKLVSRKDFVKQTTGFTGTVNTVYTHRLNAGTEAVLSASAGQVYSGIGTMTSRFDYRAGSQIVDVGGAKAGATATGLANDATSYTYTIAVDGGAAQTINVTGSTAQTYTNLITQINTDVTGATVSLVGGNLKFISGTNGASSSISLVSGGGGTNLFVTLTNFAAVRTATAGTATQTNWQFASLNSRIFMAQKNQAFTCLLETDYSVESIVGQPWVTSPNCVMAADGRLWAADDEGSTTRGYQVVAVGGNKTGASATGLVAATTYTASIVVDGGASQSISVVGSTGATFTTLIEQLDLDIAGATASMVDGNLRITSNSGGASSTVAITAGTLFAAPLAGFSAVETAVAGSATAVANSYTVWWSDLLNGKSWDGGDAGQIDLRNAFPRGMDKIVGLAMVSTRLIIFCRNSVLMYTLPADHDPASMSLTDVIENIGCTARDSIVTTDEGVFFLSDDGYYKTQRLANITNLLQLQRVSKLVSDDLIDVMDSETMTAVRAGYYPKEGWVLLAAPVANKTYCFHTKRIVPGEGLEVPVVTTWTNVGMQFRGFCFDKDDELYCAGTNGVHKYTGYTTDGADNVYTFDFYTQWTGLGKEENLKHLKNVTLTLKAASSQAGTVRWRTDYLDGTTNSIAFTTDATEFAENPGIGEVSVPIGRSCNVGKFGWTFTVTQKITAHAMRVWASTGAAKRRG